MKASKQLQLLDAILVNPVGTKFNIECEKGVTLNYHFADDAITEEEVKIAATLLSPKMGESSTEYQLPDTDGVVTLEVVNGPGNSQKAVAVQLCGTEVITNSFALLNNLVKTLSLLDKIRIDNCDELYHKLPGNVNLRWLSQVDAYKPGTVAISLLHPKDEAGINLDGVLMDTNERSYLCSETGSVVLGEGIKYVYADAGLKLVRRSNEELSKEVIDSSFSGDYLMVVRADTVYAIFTQSARLTNQLG